jgi:hypothetical protein
VNLWRKNGQRFMGTEIAEGRKLLELHPLSFCMSLIDGHRHCALRASHFREND